MSRIVRITKSFDELRDIIESGNRIQVIFRSSVAEEDGLIGHITDCASPGVQFPITVAFSNWTFCTFTADGYEYQPGENDECYIMLLDDVVKQTQVCGKFESFMKLAAEEGVSVEVAMKLYNSFTQ